MVLTITPEDFQRMKLASFGHGKGDAVFLIVGIQENNCEKSHSISYYQYHADHSHSGPLPVGGTARQCLCHCPRPVA